MEEYLSVTQGDTKFQANLCRGLRIGDPSTWITREKRRRMGMERGAEDWLLMHPSSKDEDEDEGEVVGRLLLADSSPFEFVLELTPSFARECFEASKDGKNPLVDFVNEHYPRI